MIIYGDSLSGNCYKIKLLCTLLKLDYQWIEVDILAGDIKTPSFLAKNPNGKIPLLITDENEAISESNAILYYLAQQTAFFPSKLLQQAGCLQWMFFEQYSHEPYIAVARFINKYLGCPADRLSEYKSKQEGGNKALAVMEGQLQKTSFLVGDTLTIADISLFAYTHVAEEGGFCLSQYPAVQAWINTIKSQENYINIG